MHKDLERALLEFLQLRQHGVSLFSSGYAVKTGAISAFVKQGHSIVLDRSVHMSIQEGAQLSRAKIFYFRHNDADNLEEVLKRLAPENTRILVCTEGVYTHAIRIGRYGAVC